MEALMSRVTTVGVPAVPLLMQALWVWLLGTPPTQSAPLLQLSLPPVQFDTVPPSVAHWPKTVIEQRHNITRAAKVAVNMRTTTVPLDFSVAAAQVEFIAAFLLHFIQLELR